MTVSEKVAFLKGLMEGMELDADKKEVKVIKLMADVLEDLAGEVTEVEDDIADINEYMEAMDEDLTNVEEEIFGDECDDCDCDCDCDCDDCDCDDCDDCYHVDCPSCGKEICFEEVPEGETFTCPSCGKEIPLD